MENYPDKLEWIRVLSSIVERNSDVFGKYFSIVFSKVSSLQPSEVEGFDAKSEVFKGFLKLLEKESPDMQTLIQDALSGSDFFIGSQVFDLLFLHSEKTAPLLSASLKYIAKIFYSQPELALLFEQPERLENFLHLFGTKYSAWKKLVPALADRTSRFLPDFREAFFDSLDDLDRQELVQIELASSEAVQALYHHLVRTHLVRSLQSDLKGREILVPFLDSAIKTIPGGASLNAFIQVLCTPKTELSKERILSILIQELGGLYIKVSQVLAEVAPPSLSKELKNKQDQAGSLFPSQKKSWQYVLDTFKRAEMKEWEDLVDLTSSDTHCFASASVGAIFEIKLSEKGKERFSKETLLAKIQRPHLKALFEKQKESLLTCLREISNRISESQVINDSVKHELGALVLTLKRAVTNYADQSISELDFRQERENADRVKRAIGVTGAIKVPAYYFANEDVALLERFPGAKITRIVQTRYLQRREVSNTLAESYLDLLFKYGIVWADPHPGNILFDPEKLELAMIDLNPCFVWDQHLQKEFIHLFYRLVLRDSSGIIDALTELVENKSVLDKSQFLVPLKTFLKNQTQGSLVRFTAEFLKTLSENNINLKPEVQAALRGLSQIALTTSAISSNNSFALILQRRFGWRSLLKTSLQVGPIRVLRLLTQIVFDLLKSRPQEEVGPVLDERDLFEIENAVRALKEMDVCDIGIERLSPEDYSNLVLSADETTLIKSSDLKVRVLENTRPATVQYLIEVPEKDWLRERQEFVKLSGLSLTFCIVECFEQLRRNSRDDYWIVVETWNQNALERTVEQTELVGEIRIAARKLYARRFSKIWDSRYFDIKLSFKFLWKMLLFFEMRKELLEQELLRSLKGKYGNVKISTLAFGTLFKVRILAIEFWLWFIRAQLKKSRYSMNLIPLSTGNLHNLMLHGLVRGIVN